VGDQDFGDNCHNLVHSRTIGGGHVVPIGCVGQVSDVSRILDS
jgi:hypothetical protein